MLRWIFWKLSEKSSEVLNSIYRVILYIYIGSTIIILHLLELETNASHATKIIFKYFSTDEIRYVDILVRSKEKNIFPIGVFNGIIMEM